MVNKATMCKMDKTRSRGCPKQRWSDQFGEQIKYNGSGMRINDFEYSERINKIK